MDAEDIYKKERARKLLEATESNSVTEFLVKLVYGEDFYLPARLLDTKIESYGEDVLNLADAIEKIESYNNFRGKDVANAVRYLHDKGYVASAKFGREGSPVLYVRAPFWEHQASNYYGDETKSRKYTDAEFQKMYKEIYDTLAELEPDELGETDYYGIRAWWD